ncbi:malto-oligosyltrehalose trehalohydrolase [Pinirhizobacter sp.]|uniref:malto-oligosyltrehalose trehalohydrolase n=1 Tax=Pinirhizobacter sp. TaxID=2950432 RepID=UPI002F3FE27B
MASAHHMPYGAALAGDAQTTCFRLWAPDASSVRLDIDGRGIVSMANTGGGWHERAIPVGAGTRYRFILPDGLAVPDPASRAQYGGDVHGWSVVVDPASYRWQHSGWHGRPWHETVFYEIHAGVMGGFAGVAAELPRLARMGITAVELMPIAEFPGERNWGYDGVLPYAPAAAYGRPDELKRLIDQAHGLGLMVFLDVVYNHFGPDGAYLHAYASPFFDRSAHTPWGAAIDVGKPEVGDYFVHNALYWLNEYRFDGLRFDAVHSINNDPWLCALARRIRAGVKTDRHVHLVLENEANQVGFLAEGVFDAQWNDDFHNAAHVLLTGETDGYYASYADDPISFLVRCMDEGFAYQGEEMEGKARGEPSKHLSPLRFVNFLQNHDQVGNRAHGERLPRLADPEALAAATALLLLSPFVPLLFMGEERGSRAPFLFFTDHQTEELRKAVREGRRREFARFEKYGDHMPVPDPNERRTFDDSVPDEGDQAVQGRIARLLRLRHEWLVPALPTASSLGAQSLGDRALVARWALGTRRLVIVCNLGDLIPCHLRAGNDAIWLEGNEQARTSLSRGQLAARTTLAYLENP